MPTPPSSLKRRNACARADGGRDTYFVRLWISQRVAKGLTLSGGVEQRWNETQHEQRLHQQLSWRAGVLRTRSRLEQRFVEGERRMALRVRQRLGVDVPLDDRWGIEANVEGFFTLRSGNPGGQTGLTALRTYAGVSRELGENLSLSIGYMRAQEIRSGRPDRIGHAPFAGIEFAF